MIAIYETEDEGEALILGSLLDVEEIPNQVMVRRKKGVPRPMLCILRESDLARAMEIVKEFEEKKGSSHPPGAGWRCKKCGETLEGAFTECWKCGAGRPSD